MKQKSPSNNLGNKKSRTGSNSTGLGVSQEELSLGNSGGTVDE
jgi:hypothetical protein